MLDAGLLTNLVPHLVLDEKTHDVLVEVAWVLTYIAAKAEHESDLLQANILPKLADILINTANNKPSDYQVIKITQKNYMVTSKYHKILFILEICSC